MQILFSTRLRFALALLNLAIQFQGEGKQRYSCAELNPTTQFQCFPLQIQSVTVLRTSEA